METEPLPAEPLGYYRDQSNGWEQVVKILAWYAIVAHCVTCVRVAISLRMGPSGVWFGGRFGSPFQWFLLMINLAALLLDPLYVAAGIGCLRFRPWGRRLFLICLVASFCIGVAHTVSNLIYPGVSRTMFDSLLSTAVSIIGIAAFNGMLFLLMRNRHADALFGMARS